MGNDMTRDSFEGRVDSTVFQVSVQDMRSIKGPHPIGGRGNVPGLVININDVFKEPNLEILLRWVMSTPQCLKKGPQIIPINV